MDTALLLAQESVFTNFQFWVLLIMGLSFGLYMAWSIGANDVANAMGTSVGSKALTLKQAIVVAGTLEFAGAFLVGPHVSATIRKDIIPIDALATIANGTELYVFGMLAALLAAATWLMVATYYGLPVSTTHSIVGAVLGFGLVVFWGQWSLLKWEKVSEIVASWVVSPLMSGIIAFFIFGAVQRLIIYRRDMVKAAKLVAPFLVFLVFEVITLVTLWKGLKHLDLNLSDAQSILLATGISLGCALLSVVLLRRIDAPDANHPQRGQNPLISDDLTKIQRHLGRAAETEFRRFNRGLGRAASREFEKIQQRIDRMSQVAHGDVENKLRGLESQTALTQAEVAETLRELQDRVGVARDDIAMKLRELEMEVGSVQGAVVDSHDANLGQWGTPEIRTTEKIFAYLQIISACAVAFAHGANDVANSVGPLGGVVSVLHGGTLGATATIDRGWLLGILALGGLGIVVGLATWGWRVIDTIGRKITELTPTRGFSAEFAAAITILIASKRGLPISTTHTLVGAVLGVGFARGIGALNLRVVRDIVTSWLITLPVGAGLAIVFFLILRLVFGS